MKQTVKINLCFDFIDNSFRPKV